MPTMRTFLLSLVVTASLADAACLGTRQDASVRFERANNAVDRDQDQAIDSRMVNAISPRTLQQLGEYVPGSFKDSLVQTEDNAAEDASEKKPAQVVNVVHLAVRQASSVNDTTTSETPIETPTSSSEDPPTTTSTPDEPSTTTTPTEEPTATPTEEPTTSTEESATPTEGPTDVPTSSSTTAVTPPETTETPVDTPTTSSETPSTTPESTPTPTPESTTTTTEPSSTPVTTPETTESTSSSPAPTSSSSDAVPESSSSPKPTTTAKPTSTTRISTSTLPGGAVTTITQVAVVTPGVNEGDNSDEPEAGMGNLQDDSAAPSVRGSTLALLAGLMVGGFMLV